MTRVVAAPLATVTGLLAAALGRLVPEWRR